MHIITFGSTDGSLKLCVKKLKIVLFPTSESAKLWQYISIHIFFLKKKIKWLPVCPMGNRFLWFLISLISPISKYFKNFSNVIACQKNVSLERSRERPSTRSCVFCGCLCGALIRLASPQPSPEHQTGSSRLYDIHTRCPLSDLWSRKSRFTCLPRTLGGVHVFKRETITEIRLATSTYAFLWLCPATAAAIRCG